MFTSEDFKQLTKLMHQNSDNYMLIKKLLDSQRFAISKISHEIRNPLTLVSGTLQLIQKQHPETESFSHWHQVVEDVKFMEFLLRDLSAYNNSSVLKYSLIHTSDFMNHLVLSFAAALIDTPVELTSEIDQSLPAFYGDPVKLREMFLNLLQNALDAVNCCKCENDSPHRDGSRIKIRCYLHRTDIVTEITDNGCGIAASELPDIFTPFTTHKSNGTGLGLAIVKTVADFHNGSVDVVSEYGIGTTFTVTLPTEHCACCDSTDEASDMRGIINPCADEAVINTACSHE